LTATLIFWLSPLFFSCLVDRHSDFLAVTLNFNCHFDFMTVTFIFLLPPLFSFYAFHDGRRRLILSP